MRLITTEAVLPRNREDLTHRPSEHWPRRNGVPVLTDAIDESLQVHVRVNHGRWIVDCPFCSGAQFASETDPRFLCADCGNVQIEGRWLRVVWPKEAEGIEAALILRPTENRNWRPGETPADLGRENIEHGLGG